MAQESKLWQEINALGYVWDVDDEAMGYNRAIEDALKIVEAHEMTELDQIKSAVAALEAKARTPTAFNWTPSMQAIWPVEYRPTMSGLLAIWEAMQGAAVFSSSEAEKDGWITNQVGDPCPVPRGVIIDIMDYDGFVWTNVRALESNETSNIFWRGGYAKRNHIVAWRLAR